MSILLLLLIINANVSFHYLTSDSFIYSSFLSSNNIPITCVISVSSDSEKYAFLILFIRRFGLDWVFAISKASVYLLHSIHISIAYSYLPDSNDNFINFS